MRVPSSLEWVAAEPQGKAWRRRLPALVAELAERWALSLEDGCMESDQALVVPGTRAGGEAVVLKVRPAHGGGGETELEAAALAALDGCGAVRLLEHDPERCALLVERCVPGTPLARSPGEAVGVIAALLRRQWRETSGRFPLLRERAERWAESLPALWEARGRPFERELLDAAVGHLTELAGSQRGVVLLNEDLHGDNVLRAEREPWLAIDPDPLLGEREFSLASPVRCPEFGHGEAQVCRRLDALVDATGVDWERARGWGVGHAVARAFLGRPVKPHCVEVARWLLRAAR